MSARRPSGFTFVELLVVAVIIVALVAILGPLFFRGHCECSRKSTCQSNLKQLGCALNQYVQDYDQRYPVDWRSHGRPEYARRYSWRAMLSPYVKDRAVFSCPSNPEADGFARSFHTPPYSSELPDGEGNDLSGGYGMNCVHREPGPPDPPGWAGGSIPRPITEGDIVAPCALIVFGDVQSNNHEITRWSNRTGFARRDADPKSTGCEKRRSLFRHTLPGGGATLHHGSANYCYADGHVKWLRPERIPCTREECWWSVQGKH